MLGIRRGKEDRTASTNQVESQAGLVSSESAEENFVVGDSTCEIIAAVAQVVLTTGYVWFIAVIVVPVGVGVTFLTQET